MANAREEITRSLDDRDRARPRLLTIPEAADALRISRSFLYELLSDGAFMPVRIGRLVRIDARDIANWIDAQKST